mmetsp:Transcript_27287/g.72078  ORF Transcript_27287/g.72078 Transcript_27287/m.72078 type:complete len:245 (+) Transcript_27287:389-1123(+)
MVAPDHHLRVVDEVQGEEEHAASCVDLVHQGHRRRVEHGVQPQDKVEEHHRHERRVEVRAHTREVRLGEAGVEGEGPADAGRGEEGHEEGRGRVHHADEADHHGHGQREDREEDVVRREAPERALAATCHRHHHAHRAEHGPVVDARVRANPVGVQLGVEPHRDRGRHGELHEEDGVDLADEAAPDIGGALLDGLPREVRVVAAAEAVASFFVGGRAPVVRPLPLHGPGHLVHRLPLHRVVVHR